MKIQHYKAETFLNSRNPSQHLTVVTWLPRSRNPDVRINIYDEGDSLCIQMTKREITKLVAGLAGFAGRMRTNNSSLSSESVKFATDQSETEVLAVVYTNYGDPFEEGVCFSYRGRRHVEKSVDILGHELHRLQEYLANLVM